MNEAAMLHRRILLDGAVYLRRYRPEHPSPDARVNEGRKSYVAGLAARLGGHLEVSLPEERKPCPVVAIPVRAKVRTAPSTPPRFALGERQNGQTFFYWQEPPPAPLYFFPEISR